MELTAIDMPRPDGARYVCQLYLSAPSPIFWQKCDHTAKFAYQETNGRKHLRCHFHRNIHTRNEFGDI